MSLDVFRGLTIVGMLLVNVPGDESATYSQLRHSAWSGWSIADLVFPFFLFVVGVTTHLSLHSRAERGATRSALYHHIVRRGLLIFGIGVLLNWFPFYLYGPIAGHPQATFLDHVIGRLLELRFLGVLQRIGLAYVAAAALTLGASTRRIVATALLLLVAYWGALTLLPVPGEGTTGLHLLSEPGRTLAAWVDHVTLDWTRWGLGNHIWQGTVIYDPEGFLSTIPAIATVLLGVLAGRWLGSVTSLGERLTGLFVAGWVLIAAGLAWGLVFPINKSLWTSSYVLFTAGAASATFATIGWLVDVKRWRRWTIPLVAFGVNPITAYVGAELSTVLFDSTIKLRANGRLQSLHELAYRALTGALLPNVASLAYSVAFITLWYLVLRVLYQRGIVLKI